MKTFIVAENTAFIGRDAEKRALKQADQADGAKIVIFYGRRRVGKTELLEQVFRKRHILKFEGVEGQDQRKQMQQVMFQLAEYTEQPLLRDIKVETWSDVFRYIHQYTSEGKWTIYFEELQWLANYQDDFVSELKLSWDNLFRRNNQLLLILCGSSPSFMINHVVHSKALYNRSQHEMHLNEFNLIETAGLLNKHSHKDIMSAYLSIGGIPEYLLRLKSKSSLFLGLCEASFKKDGFFNKEYKKIFISRLAQNPHYQKAIEFLSKKRYATRDDILQHLNIQTGGRSTELIDDLVLCGFIDKYSPYSALEDTRLTRYCLKDYYLQFYFKFIHPHRRAIAEGKYDSQPALAIKRDTYQKWLGFAFERFCRSNAHVIANILGFKAVQYDSGAYFNRRLNDDFPGFQIDLLFDRKDGVITICEIKFTDTPISQKIIEEFERKIERLPNNIKNKTIHKVLITAAPVNDKLKASEYFDQVITLEELFDSHYWK